jgi:ATP-dependent Clp protease ATP-binding subunit ClpA
MRTVIRQQCDSLPRNHLEKVLENELDLLQQRVLEPAKGQFLFRVTGSAREFLLLNATEQCFGEQRLKLATERYIVYPLANLFATDQTHVGDNVRIDWDHNQPRLNFTREVKNLATPARRFEPKALEGSVPRKVGQSVEALSV